MKQFCVFLVLGLTLQGCTDENVTDPVQLEARPFFGVAMTPLALNIALGETYQLGAMPVDGRGSPLVGLPAPEFRSTDTTRVTVSPSGVVTGVRVGAALVIGKVQSDDLTYADTATVTVLASPVTLASFSIFPEDDTIATNGYLEPTVAATDGTGAPIAGLGEPHYVLTDPTVAEITARLGRRTRVEGISPGQIQLIGTITVSGVTMVDTATVTVMVIYPMDVTAFMLPGSIGFNPSAVLIGTGGTVTWLNFTFDGVKGESYDVTFDDPSQIPEGNIPAFAGDSEDTFMRSRTFPVAGTYPYRSTTNGAEGVIVVRDN